MIAETRRLSETPDESLLKRLRELGLTATVVEKGSKSSGVWYRNRYLGARVDSEMPMYQLFDRELWEGFTFQERYPGWQDLRRYFEYIEDKVEDELKHPLY